MIHPEGNRAARPAALFWIAAGGLALRILTVPLLHAGGYTSDEKEYIFLGEEIARGDPFVDSNGEQSTRSPLFPFLLGGVFALPGGGLLPAHVLGCILGALAIPLGYKVSLVLLHDARAALFAAAAIALYPGLVIYSALLQTESLFIFFFLGTFLAGYRLLDRPSATTALVLGVLSGLAALTRAVFLGFFPFFLISFVWLAKSNLKRVVVVMPIVILVFVLTILPWTIRNYRIHDTIVPISSFAGKSLLLGNNPFSTGTWSTRPGFEEWFEREASKRGFVTVDSLSETDINAASTEIAVDYMTGHPLESMVRALTKIHIFWIFPITNSDTNYLLQGIAVGSDFLLLCSAMIGYVVTRKKMPWVLPIFGALLAFTCIHAVLHAEARYRLPIVPFLCLLAGAGLTRLVEPEGLKSLLSSSTQRNLLAALLGVVVCVYLYTGWLFVEGSV